MGGFTPNLMGSSSSAGSSLPPPPDFTTPAGTSGIATTTDSLGRNQPGASAGGFSYASGGDLPGSHQMTSPTMDPTLTNSLLGYLTGQLGQGLPAFNQSVNLPSGGSTAPGQLTAGENPILQQLQSFMTGQSGPGSLPGVLPMFQSEMAAMQQPIQQSEADLREQFGSSGALGSTEFGTAMSNFASQTSANEMALLTSATMSALPTMLSAGMDVQGLDQQSIQNAYNQFMTDLPQNNPLMGDVMSMGQMTTSPSYSATPSFGSSLASALMGNAGDILSTAGSAANSAMPNLPGWASILLGG
jgi:hypothetical protein